MLIVDAMFKEKLHLLPPTSSLLPLLSSLPPPSRGPADPYGRVRAVPGCVRYAAPRGGDERGPGGRGRLRRRTAQHVASDERRRCGRRRRSVRPLPHGETLPPLFPLATTGCSGAALVSSALLDLVAEINNLLRGLNIMPLSLYGSFFI